LDSTFKSTSAEVPTGLINNNNSVLNVLSLKEGVHDTQKVCQMTGSVPKNSFQELFLAKQMQVMW
jgi:hypothetical protein